MELISRKDAGNKGLKYYFTGKPCVKGLIDVRRVSTGQCQCKEHLNQYIDSNKDYEEKNRESLRVKQKNYREENRTKRNQQMADWYQKNKQYANQKQNERRAENREKYRKYDREWYWNNRDSRMLSSKAYRTKNLQQVNSRKNSGRLRNVSKLAPWFDEFDQMVSDESYALSLQRTIETGCSWEVDHIVPFESKMCSGLHCASNIRVIPSMINRIKGSRLILQDRFDWLKYLTASSE